MIRCLLLVLLFTMFSCSSRDADYWMNPVNQNGDLRGFSTTDDYCKRIVETKSYIELERLSNLVKDSYNGSPTLRDSLFVNSKAIDALVMFTFRSLDNVRTEFMEACGGYCGYTPNEKLTPPALPFRTLDSDKYWSNENNMARISKIQELFIEEMSELIGSDSTIEFSNPIDIESLFRDKNTINSMIGFCQIELQLLEIRDNAITSVKSRNAVKNINHPRKLFDQTQPFEIIKLSINSDYPSSDPDTSYCSEWRLTRTEVSRFLKDMKPITGHEWHYLFEHYPCVYRGTLEQHDQIFEFAINGGSWLTISSDTTVYFGDTEGKFEQLFLDTVWDGEEE